MKIGFLIYGSLDTLSGGYLYDRKLVESLRAAGDEVEIISLPWRNYAGHLADNLTFRLPSGLDVLIQDELNHPSLLAANAGEHPYPIISLVHHLRSSEQHPKWQNDLYRRVEKRYLQSVDGFIFNSQTTKNVVNGVLSDEKPSMIAYPPTDRFGLGLAEGQVMDRAYRDPFRILFLGNVIRRKGLHTLLQAVAGLNCRLDVAGSLDSEPEYAREMQHKAAAFGFPSSVNFHGPLDNEPLVRLLEQAHLLAVPSSYEGFGIVYLEGMAFGLPAIGTSAGAASEIIADGGTGYLIEPDDDKTLAARITFLAGDRGLLARMSGQALERYRLQPNWGQTAGQIREFLLGQLRK